MRTKRSKYLGVSPILLLGAALASWILTVPAAAVWASVENATCLDCHGDASFTVERGGETVSLFVDSKVFAASVHAGLDCVSCHQDADVPEMPHPERLAPDFCGN